MTRTHRTREIAVALTASLFTGAALAAQNDDIRVQLEQPVAGEPTTGVGIVRGWALAPAGIDRVELYIDEDPDGSPNQVLAYGGSRGGVCATFSGASYPDCSPARPGFASAFNFNLLNDGEHEFTVRAFDDNGDHNDASASFDTQALGEDFISDASRLSLPAFEITGVRRDGDQDTNERVYDLEFEWSQAAQRYVVTQVSGFPPSFPPFFPGLPTGLSASKTGGNVELTWTDPSTGVQERWYIVERRFQNTVFSNEFDVIAVLPEDTTSYTDSDVTLEAPIAGTYTYRVTATTAAANQTSGTVTVNQESSLVTLNE